MERAHNQFGANSLLRVIAGKIAAKKPGNFLFWRKPAWILAMRKEAGNLQGICRQFYLAPGHLAAGLQKGSQCRKSAQCD